MRRRRGRHRLARPPRRAAASSPPTRHADVALLAAAIEAYDGELDVEPVALLRRSPRRGRPQCRRATVGRAVEFRHRGHALPLSASASSARTATACDRRRRRVEVDVERLGDVERRLRLRRPPAPACSRAAGRRSTRRGRRRPAPHLRATRAASCARPRPAWSSSVPVAPGDEVAAGDVVAVVESMKMETAVTAPFAGRVRECWSRPNVQVDAGAPLRAARAARRPASSRAPATRVDFGRTAGAATAPTRAARPATPALPRARLRRRPADAAIGADLADGAGAIGPAVHADRRARSELLALFADLRALLRGRAATRSTRAARCAQPAGAPAHLPALARRRGRGAARRASSPRLRAGARATTASTSLRRTPELEEACCASYRSQQRVDDAACRGDRRSSSAGSTAASSAQRAGTTSATLLDRLVADDRGPRPGRRRPRPRGALPLLRRAGARAPRRERDVRARWSDAPRRARAARRRPGPRPTASDALVDCPQPLRAAALGRMRRPARRGARARCSR